MSRNEYMLVYSVMTIMSVLLNNDIANPVNWSLDEIFGLGKNLQKIFKNRKLNRI